MKNFFLPVITLIVIVSFFPVSSRAAFSTEMDKQTKAFVGPQGANFPAAQDPRVVAALLIRSAITLVGTLFLAYTVYAGYLILTSRGNEEAITKAKDTLRTAVLGILITLSSYALVTFVSQSILAASGGRNLDATPLINLDNVRYHAGDSGLRNPDPFSPPDAPWVPQ